VSARRGALVLAVAAALAAMPSSALACPVCGLDGYRPAVLVAFGLFLSAPFVLAGVIARRIRALDRGDSRRSD
jgi:hypothetical protein